MRRLLPRLFLLLIGSLFGVHLYSQKIEGRVLDAQKEIAPYTTVVLYSCDSVFVDGCVTDSLGKFSFNYDKLPYLLEVRHISYTPFKHLYNTFQCGDIILKEKVEELQNVTVTAQRPFVKRVGANGLDYSGEAIRTQYITNTAYDVVRRLPGIIEQDGTLQLIGARELTIVINGQRSTLGLTQLYSLLQSIPSDRVNNIKVLYNAPPQYHTQGAVIDIVLTRAIQFQGSLYSQYGYRYGHNVKAGANVEVPLDKVTLEGGYEYALSNTQSEIDLSGKHLHQNKRYDIQQIQKMSARSHEHQLRLGINYNINDKSRFNATYNAFFTPYYKSNVASNGNFVSGLNSVTAGQNTQNISAQYQHNSGWNANVDYTHYNTGQDQELTQQYKGGGREEFQVHSAQFVDRLNVSLDKRIDLSGRGAISLGSDFSYSKSYNSNRYKQSQGSQTLQNVESQLSEYAASVYGGYEKQFTPTLHASGNLTAFYYKRADINKWLFFPSLAFSYMPNMMHIVQGTLSSSRKYAGYTAMQNVVNYLDGYAQVHGNPELLPQQSYDATLVYLLQQKYVMQLSLNYTDNYFTQNAYQDPNDLKLIYKTMNWDFSKEAHLTFVLPFQPFKWFNTRLTLDGCYKQVKSNNFYGYKLDRKKLFGMAHLSNNIILSSKPNIVLQVDAYYMSPQIQATYDIGHIFGLNAAVKYTSPNKQLNISLMGNDLTETATPLATSHWGTQNLRIFSGQYKRSIELRVSYNFGGYKEKSQKKVDTSRFGI